DLVARLQADSQLGRFWHHRGADGIAREKQLLVDFLCSSAGGPLYYTGRDMRTSHAGMGISESDWTAFMGHVNATLDHFGVPQTEHEQVLGFAEPPKGDMVGVETSRCLPQHPARGGGHVARRGRMRQPQTG